MIFIIGFHKSDKEQFEHRRWCDRCGHETLFSAVRRKSYLDLFFIPIPLGKGKMLDVCRVCGTGYENVPYAEYSRPVT